MSARFGRGIGALAAACLVALGACSQSGESARKLVVTGSSTVAPLMSEIAKRFEARHPGVRIDVQTGGSSRGVNDARQGLADVGMASRAANDDEKELTFTPIALDGIAMIVHASNPVQELSADQVRAIYRDEIDNWVQIGGPDLPITVVNKSEGRSTLELFLEYFELEPAAIQADVIVGDNAQDIKSVASDPSAIGYVSVGSAEFEMKRGTTLKALPLGGVPPSIDSVRDGKFPLSRPLNLVTAEAPEGLARELIEFAASPDVRDLVEGQFFVPLADPS